MRVKDKTLNDNEHEQTNKKHLKLLPLLTILINVLLG